MRDRSIKAVRSKNIARKLRIEGFKIIRKEPNVRFPEQDVYIFEATPELVIRLRELVEDRERWKKK